MPRGPRYVPEESLVEITCRTIQGRYLLRPSKRLNELVLGVIGRAQRLTGMRICAFVYLSNHCHLLLWPTDADQMVRFMRYLNSNLAREAGRLHRWRDKLWGRRYTDIPVSREPEAQLARLRYILEQGVKEDLVESPLQWPGVQSARCLTRGESLRGIWIDRTARYRRRRKPPKDGDDDCSSTETVELTPLPCWIDLSEAQRQTRTRALVRQIVSEHARRRGNRQVLGRRAILEQHPHDRPARSKHSPAPRFHAATAAARKMLETAYRSFCSAYRQAAADLKAGRDALFPPGSFPGPGRFVPLRI